MSTIEEPFVVEAKLVLQLKPATDRNELLRRVVRELGGFSGAEFVPRGARAASFMRGEISAGRVVLIHPQFTEQKNYPNSWIAVSLEVEEARGFVFVSIHMGRPGEQIDLEWKMGLEIVPRLSAKVAPTLAFMNGRLVDVESVVFPPDEPLPGTSLPAIFTPWTFFDSEKLDAETRKKLIDLPAEFSGPLANGWVVQAVKKLQDQPKPEFLDALKTLTDKPIRYLGPRLTSDE